MQPAHVYARLGRDSDLMPWNGRMFGRGTDVAGYEIVDPRDTHTAALIADGSIVVADPPSPPSPAPTDAGDEAPASHADL